MPRSPQDAEQSPKAVLFFVLWRGLAHRHKHKNKTDDLFKSSALHHFFAEREGFEPPEPLSSTVFKTAAIDHSAISPGAKV